jgi:murein DD-endopeptidase MepM/ murein hydrolase activator NlpD
VLRIAVILLPALAGVFVVPPAHALGSKRTQAAGAAGAWQWPLRGPVARPFAVTADRFAAGQHRGVDLAARPGRPVLAACSGRVRFAGRVAGHGGVVSVACGRLVATYLELGAITAARGRRVRAGQRLGSVGAEAHLHLGARDTKTGRYVDPLTLLAGHRGPPLGPAPGPARARPARAPDARPPAPAPTPAPAPAPVGDRTPALVPPLAWAGLALIAAGLPLGGLVAVHRSRQRTSWTSTSDASRLTSSAR